MPGLARERTGEVRHPGVPIGAACGNQPGIFACPPLESLTLQPLPLGATCSTCVLNRIDDWRS